MDLTKLDNLETVGPDAFSNIVGLQTVKLTETQAKVINPGVFSGVGGEDGKPTDLKIEVSGLQADTLTFSSQAFGTSSITLTPSSNLNKFTGVTEINLAATNVTTLEGGVLWGNEKITKLVLPATASSWKLTDVKEYSSAPLGGNNTALSSGQGIFFERFSTTAGQVAQNFSDIDWSLVANILNMFGRIETSSDVTNLSVWAEGFSGGELTAESVKRGWSSDKDGQNGSTSLESANQGTSPLYKLVNGVEWKYTSNAGSITLSIESPDKRPNAYRAGYTNNPYASYQVGFGSNDGVKIDPAAQVTVTLTLVTTKKSK